ncbi:hypothetical protein LTR84_004407 [Exophiala bonariae]|uniref:Uncharacterized protein n=1 Tax=Exophiala bonariae TaxID=1690606 RepID=A0AAV9N5T4_9EURO|nr:hypothetical protein LTR84_004407 [Exophiala bonariae]
MSSSKDERDGPDLSPSGSRQKPTGLRTRAHGLRQPSSYQQWPPAAITHITVPPGATRQIRSMTHSLSNTSPSHPSPSTPVTEPNKKTIPWGSGVSDKFGFKPATSKSLRSPGGTVTGTAGLPELGSPRSKSDGQQTHIPVMSPTRKPGVHPSPQDKPLPRLPILGVKPNSPTRTPLMDRDGKPRRRNVVTPGSGVSKQEKWPVMLSSQPKIAPTMDGSAIQGMSNMDLNRRSDVTSADRESIETFTLDDDSKGKGRATKPFPLFQTDARPPLSPGGLLDNGSSRGLGRHHRGSSIPVRSGAPRPSHGRFHDSPVHHKSYPHALEADAFDLNKYSPEPSPISSGFTAGIQLRSATTPVTAAHELSAVKSNNQLSLKEILSLPYQDVIERSYFSSDSSEESDIITRGYDAHGGYDIKRPYHTSTGGPTLRIRDSASDLLLDKGTTELNNRTAGGGRLRRKQTQNNLRQGDGIRTSLRSTSAFIHRSLSSLTKQTSEPFSAGESRSRASTQNLLPQTTQQLITNFSSDQHNLIGTDQGQPSPLSFPSTASSERGFFNQPSLNPFRQSVAEEFRQVISSSSSHHRPSVSQVDWQNQEFTEIKMPTAIKPAPLQESSPTATDPGPITLPRTRPTNIPRSASAIMPEEPNEETAPFLFDKDEHLSKQPSTSNNLPRLRVTGPDAPISPDKNFPLRTTSRKQRPPPLFVSDKSNSRFSTRYTTEVSQALDETVVMLRKPRNMKTFSQSHSPGTNIKASAGLLHTPSKKAFGRVRGLLKKKSTDETLGKPSATGFTKIPSLLGIHTPPTVRRTAVPAASRFPNTLLDPNSALHEDSDNSRTKLLSTQNRPADPITPFTAGIHASPASSGRPSSIPRPRSPISARPTSSTMGIKSPAPAMSRPQSGQTVITSSPPPVTTQDDSDASIAPELQSALRVGRALMRATVAETDPERRQRLGQLAECMVRMIHVATKAIQAAETAEIEKIKADMAATKCLSALAHSEPIARELLAMMDD